MATEVGGLNSWRTVIVSIASDTGDIQVQVPDGLPGTRKAVAIVGTTLVAGTESGTTDGLYTFARSGTTAADALLFIV